jgi:hypothetical protein
MTTRMTLLAWWLRQRAECRQLLLCCGSRVQHAATGVLTTFLHRRGVDPVDTHKNTKLGLSAMPLMSRFIICCQLHTSLSCSLTKPGARRTYSSHGGSISTTSNLRAQDHVRQFVSTVENHICCTHWCGENRSAMREATCNNSHEWICRYMHGQSLRLAQSKVGISWVDQHAATMAFLAVARGRQAWRGLHVNHYSSNLICVCIWHRQVMPRRLSGAQGTQCGCKAVLA